MVSIVYSYMRWKCFFVIMFSRRTPIRLNEGCFSILRKKLLPILRQSFYSSAYRKQAIFLAVFGLSFCFGDVGHVSELFHFLDTSFEAGYEPKGIKQDLVLRSFSITYTFQRSFPINRNSFFGHIRFYLFIDCACISKDTLPISKITHKDSKA